MFFFVDGDGVVLKIEQDLHLTVTLIFEVAFDDCLFEVAKEAENMPIEMDPFRLV